MATNKTFFLPDLGEGLPDAEIVEWMVKVGDTIHLDAAAGVDGNREGGGRSALAVFGQGAALAGGAGDVITTGAWLAGSGTGSRACRSAPKRQDTGHAHGGGHAAPPPEQLPLMDEERLSRDLRRAGAISDRG